MVLKIVAVLPITGLKGLEQQKKKKTSTNVHLASLFPEGCFCQYGQRWQHWELDKRKNIMCICLFNTGINKPLGNKKEKQQALASFVNPAHQFLRWILGILFQHICQYEPPMSRKKWTYSLASHSIGVCGATSPAEMLWYHGPWHGCKGFWGEGDQCYLVYMVLCKFCSWQQKKITGTLTGRGKLVVSIIHSLIQLVTHKIHMRNQTCQTYWEPVKTTIWLCTHIMASSLVLNIKYHNPCFPVFKRQTRSSEGPESQR